MGHIYYANLEHEVELEEFMLCSMHKTLQPHVMLFYLSGQWNRHYCQDIALLGIDPS